VNAYVSELENLLSRHYAEIEPDPCPQGVDLARYVAADLSEEEQEHFKRHLATCPACQADMRGYEELAGAWQGPASEAKIGRAWFRSWPRLALAASAAMLLLALALFLPPDSPRSPERKLIPKGAFELLVAAERKGHTFRVENGSVLNEGDRLGFFYSATQAGYLMILYIDESGELVRLYPAEELLSSPVVQGINLSIPDGALVKTGSGCEWVVGIFSRRELSEALLGEAVKKMWARRSSCRLDREAAKLDHVDIQVIQVRR